MLTHELLPIAQALCGIFEWWQVLAAVAIIVIIIAYKIYRNKQMND